MVIVHRLDLRLPRAVESAVASLADEVVTGQPPSRASQRIGDITHPRQVTTTS